MDKKARIATITVLVIAMSVVALMVYAAPRKCSNGVDDDNDGLADYPADPGCSSSSDNSETGAYICDNGVDQTNDRDTLADYRLSGGDPGCTSPTDSSEIDGDCDDLADETNDRDTLADGSDLGCTSTSDTSEIDGDCDDLDDEANDRDTFADGSDPGCTSTSDTSETDGDCDDLDDEANDQDTLTDSTDPGCVSTSDTGEVDGDCDDFLDNEGDLTIDYTNVNGTADPECGSYADVEWNCSETDGGYDTLVQGTTSGSFGGTPFSETDFCLDTVVLNEYYCDPYNLGSEYVNCAAGNLTNTTSCSNGACV